MFLFYFFLSQSTVAGIRDNIREVCNTFDREELVLNVKSTYRLRENDKEKHHNNIIDDAYCTNLSKHYKFKSLLLNMLTNQ